MSTDTLKSPTIETLFVKKIKQPSNGMNNISIIIKTNNLQQQKQRKKIKHVPVQIARAAKLNSNIKVYNNKNKQTSMCEIKCENKISKRKISISDTLVNKSGHPYNSTLIVNTMSEYSDCFNPFRNTCIGQIKWRVYRCQLGTQEDSCCCSCNSDAMFEVMKSLYDCYKKKNCDNCNCILCGHLPREERKLGGKRKSAKSVAVGAETETKIVKKKLLTKKAEKDMKGKSHMEKENILRDLAKTGAPLPQGKTASEKSLIKKINAEEGISEEKSETTKKVIKKFTKKAVKEMKGKTPAEKEKILKELVDSGAPLPRGKTASDKAIIKKVRADLGLPLETKLADDKEKMTEAEEFRKATADELYMQLIGKTPEQKENILRGFAENRMPLPIGKTESEKKIIEQVRKDLGLPPEPKTPEERKKVEKAVIAGIVTPLEGKSKKQQQKTLKAQLKAGIPLPEGRTTSEKALIAEVKAKSKKPLSARTVLSEESRKARADKLYTQLKGKTPDQKEKILKGFAENRMPLPIGKTESEKKVIEKVRKELGLPPEPTTPEERKNLEKAIAAGIVTPLEGKNKQQQQKTLKAQYEAGIPLPEGRTTSEKALIAEVKAKSKKPQSARAVPSEESRKARADELHTQIKGKTPDQKEKILRGFAKNRVPLPIGKTESDKKIIEKVRKDLGLPPEPNTPEERENLEKAIATGIVTPLEGKSKQQQQKTLKAQVEAGIPLPEGRTTSEKSLIAEVKAKSKKPPSARAVPSEESRKARADEIHTQLKGKTPDQKEKILRGFAKNRVPLPIGETESDKKIIKKVRKDLGLPPEPNTPEERENLEKAIATGIVTPLEGKSKQQQQKTLKAQVEAGIPLPEGRTTSEKSLITKVKATSKPLKPTREVERKEASAHKLAKFKKLDQKTAKIVKESKGPSDECICGLFQEKALLTKIPSKKLKAPPEKKPFITEVKEETKRATSAIAIPSEKLRKAEAAGLLTPLEGKTSEQKEIILRGLAINGILPQAKTASEKRLIKKVRKDLGLPPEPNTAEERKNLEKAIAAGIVTPLEGKSKQQQQKTLKDQLEAGIPLPEGRTTSEKALIAEVKAKSKKPLSARAAPSEETRKAKADELYTQLKGKTLDQKETILRSFAENRVPLPIGKTKSEKKIIKKVRQDLGLPPEPSTPEERKNLEKATAAGIVTPLEGKSKQQQQKTLKAQFEAGIPLPEGRTTSEKALIAEVKAKSKTPLSARATPSEEARLAKADELYTQLKGKTPDQKEKILKGYAENRVPLPIGKTKSENKIIEKVRHDLGLPPEPKTPEEKKNLEKAIAAGIVTPLAGKSKQKQQKILKAQFEAGIPLPEGRTTSEKALIAEVKAKSKTPLSARAAPSEEIRKAKADELYTQLKGKTPDQKEKILRGFAENRVPLPIGKTKSEKNIIEKVRHDLGLPPEPKTPEERKNLEKAIAAGIVTPLEGKSKQLQQKTLKAQIEAGIPLPEGRTTSEKSLIAKVKATTKPIEPTREAERTVTPAHQLAKIKKLDQKTAKVMTESNGPSDECICGLLSPVSERAFKDKKKAQPTKIPSEKIKAAKAAGFLTPLAGKIPEQLDYQPKTASEKEVTDKERKELGLPPEPRTESLKDQYAKAQAQGLMTPLKGKSVAQKEKILKAQAEAGIPLPEGRTTSEKALIAKVKATTKPLKPSSASKKQVSDNERKELGLLPELRTESLKDRYAKAQAQGLITPIKGKSAAQKEKILRAQAKAGIPLPEGRTTSEKALIAKVKATTESLTVPSEKLRKAKAAGLLTPLEGKTSEHKERVLRGLAINGILPQAKTTSEKKLINKVRKDLGLPPEPNTLEERKNLQKAIAAGIVTPLEGKSKQQKQKTLKAQFDAGIPLPEGRTSSEKSLIANIKATSNPLKPTREVERTEASAHQIVKFKKLDQKTAKIIKESKGPSDECICGLFQDKEKALLTKIPSEKLKVPAAKKPFITEVKEGTKRATSAVAIPSEKLRKAKAAGLLTPLEGKTSEQKEKILRGLAINGILPQAKTASEKTLMNKVRKDLGLPPEPNTAEERKNLERAIAAGIVTPLEGKSKQQQQKTLKAQFEAGIPLPEGRTSSERALIAKVKAKSKKALSLSAEPSRESRKAKADELYTQLKDKTPEQKEKILRGFAENRVPLPIGKTKSEKKIIEKVRQDLGLPPEPNTPEERKKLEKAIVAGIVTPLKGKSKQQQQKTLKAQFEAGIPLPEGRTTSEKALIAEVKAKSRKALSLSPVSSKESRKSKADELYTQLKGKTPEQKEKILRGFAENRLPLPIGKTKSEKKIIEKVRQDLGLPPEPNTPEERKKLEKAIAAGIVTPIEGKSRQQQQKTLKAQFEAGIPLPEGRTSSERELIAEVKAKSKKPLSLSAVPSGDPRKAKADELYTQLKGKTTEQKEKVLRGFAENRVPLPIGKTKSEKKIIKKVRQDLGLPPEPNTPEERKKLEKAIAAGIVTPLKGKSKQQQQKTLKAQFEAGIPLPEGRTSSEKSLIAKIKATSKPLRPTREVERKEASAHQLAKFKKLDQKTAKIVKESKGPSDECICGLFQDKEKALLTKIPSEKPKAQPEKKPLITRVKEDTKSATSAVAIPSEKLRKAKAAGLLTPLEGKTSEQKERILRGLAINGILPQAKTASEKKLMNKVRKDLGLPPEPNTPEERKNLEKAIAAGIVTPLEGKSKQQQQKTLKAQFEVGIPLPEGRTSSEKALIAEVKANSKKPLSARAALSDETQKAKADELYTQLKGKTPDQKEKILRDFAENRIPLPIGKTQSEKKIIKKVRQDLGLPPEPNTPEERKNLDKAIAAGIVTPLEGKSKQQQQKTLKAQFEAGIPLPEGRTSSERELIAEVKAKSKKPLSTRAAPSEETRKAKADELYTQLKGKTLDQKETILRSFAENRVPLPIGKTKSEKKIIEKVRQDLGLPPEPKTPEERKNLEKAIAAGVVTPLEGKSKQEQQKTLKAQFEAGIPLPEGRTTSEKALIADVKAKSKKALSLSVVPSEESRKAKADELYTQLKGKTPEQKEQILRDFAENRLPLPIGKTKSEKKIIDKVRQELGLPPEPSTPEERKNLEKAIAAGIVTPLEGKSKQQQQKTLKAQFEAGIPLPEGRTTSEKALIAEVKAKSKKPLSARAAPSEETQKAKADELYTQLKGKTRDQKEKILRSFAENRVPLPIGKTKSEKKIIVKVRQDLGLPPEPSTPEERKNLEKAIAAGIVTPLKGKTKQQKRKTLKAQFKAGIPLPEGRTTSEKSLIAKVKATTKSFKPTREAERSEALAYQPAKVKKLDQNTAKVMKESKGPSDECICGLLSPLLTPLAGKTREQREYEPRTASEKQVTDKERRELGLPPVPRTESLKDRYAKAQAQGLITPIKGKSAAQKEKILKAQAEAGILLPEGRTKSEKSLIAKVKAETKRILSPAKEIVDTEYGIPKAETPSEKEIVRKAKAEGLMSPLTGKSKIQKEKILKGLAEAGLPMPEGKTKSDKELIKKVRIAVGLPAKATASEKLGKIKKKTKKVGEAGKLKKVKETGSGYAKVDLSEEYEDIIKTSTCDRGCGCDKKKIRFKHSYVKIRVTSPDISSLCPCPDECVPGVKGGVFVDNEGIKVTVGSAIGVPSFSIDNENRNNYGATFSNLSLVTGSFKTLRDSAVNKYRIDLKILYKNYSCVNSDYSGENIGQYRNFEEKRQNHQIYEIETNSNIIQETCTSTYLIAYSESVSSLDSDFPILLQYPSTNFHSKLSIDTEELASTESSLSLLTESSAIGTVSILSLHNSSIISNSSHYIYYHYSRSTNSAYAEDSEYPTNIINYSALDSRASVSDEVNNYSPPNLPFATKPSKRKMKRKETKTRTFVFDMTQSERPDEIIKKDPRDLSDENNKPIIVINNLNSEMDVLKMVDEILAKNKFGNSSSIYVVVPTSDDYDTDMSDSVSSTLCFNSPKNYLDRSIADTNPTLKPKRELKVRPKSQRDNPILEDALRKAELKTVEKRRRHVALDTTENAPYSSLEKLQGTLRLNSSKQFKVPNTSLLKHIVASQGNDQDPKCSLPHYNQTKTQTTAVAVPNIGPKPYKKSANPNIACNTKFPLTPKKGLHISIPVTRRQSRTDKIKQEQSVATQAFGCSLDDSKAKREMPKEHGTLTASPFKEYTLPYNQKKSISWCELPLNMICREHITNKVSRNSMNTQIKCFWKNGERENLHRENENEKYRSKQNRQVHPSNTRSCGCGPVDDCKTISQLEEARYAIPKYKCIPSSPVRVCDIQPCAGYIDFEPTIELKPTIKLKEQLAAINEQLKSLQQDQRDTKPPRMLSSMSDCHKCTKMISGDGRPRETKRSVGCGPDCREYREIPRPKGRDQCSACGRQKNELQLPSGCPCEAHPKKETANKSEILQTNSSNFHKSNENACRCKVKNNNKKIVVCECPEDEPELEPVIYYDEREDSKMRSDQTQTTSGFRFKVKKRVPLQEEMSYEEALNYYAEHPDEDVGMGDNCLCLSDGMMINKNCVCDCPYLLVEPELPEEEPRGLTLHVPGKGTGSKGLGGICCFDKI